MVAIRNGVRFRDDEVGSLDFRGRKVSVWLSIRYRFSVYRREDKCNNRGILVIYEDSVYQRLMK